MLTRIPLADSAHASGAETVDVVTLADLPMSPAVIEVTAKVLARSETGEVWTQTICATFARSINVEKLGTTFVVIARRSHASLADAVASFAVGEGFLFQPTIVVRFTGVAGKELDIECALDAVIV